MGADVAASPACIVTVLRAAMDIGNLPPERPLIVTKFFTEFD